MIKLLLVEDDANLCYIIRGGLEDMIGGYEVMTASNGEEGLKIWKEQHLDIIISDIEMPVMDGYEMVRRIRETDGFIPIVFTSGRVSPGFRSSPYWRFFRWISSWPCRFCASTNIWPIGNIWWNWTISPELWEESCFSGTVRI